MLAAFCLLFALAVAAGFAPTLRSSRFSVEGCLLRSASPSSPSRSAAGIGTVDLERVKYFFNDPKVSTVTGQFTEQIVSDVLIEAGFSSHPIPLNPLPRVKFELPNQLWTDGFGSLMGELDALVAGPSSAVSTLCDLCPVHLINDDDLLLASPEYKILAVEVQSTMVTLLSKLSEFDGAGMATSKAKKSSKRSPDSAKEQSAEEGKKSVKKAPYWLLQPLHIHKVVFLNGGQRSKNFILSGGDSSNKEEREAWHTLRQAKVSLFYKQSFTLEWTTDLSNAVEHQAAKLEHQSAKLGHQADEVKALRVLVQSLIDGKDRKDVK